MSAGIGSAAITLAPTATGFSGTYTSTSAIAPGTPVEVGTCSGAITAHTTVVAD